MERVANSLTIIAVISNLILLFISFGCHYSWTVKITISVAWVVSVTLLFTRVLKGRLL